jgi:hypothetical protein
MVREVSLSKEVVRLTDTSDHVSLPLDDAAAASASAAAAAAAAAATAAAPTASTSNEGVAPQGADVNATGVYMYENIYV